MFVKREGIPIQDLRVLQREIMKGWQDDYGEPVVYFVDAPEPPYRKRYWTPSRVAIWVFCSMLGVVLMAYAAGIIIVAGPLIGIGIILGFLGKLET